MQGERQDVDFPVAEKNDERMECLTADGVESWWLTWWIS